MNTTINDKHWFYLLDHIKKKKEKRKRKKPGRSFPSLLFYTPDGQQLLTLIELIFFPRHSCQHTERENIHVYSKHLLSFFFLLNDCLVSQHLKDNWVLFKFSAGNTRLYPNIRI